MGCDWCGIASHLLPQCLVGAWKQNVMNRREAGLYKVTPMQLMQPAYEKRLMIRFVAMRLPWVHRSCMGSKP